MEETCESMWIHYVLGGQLLLRWLRHINFVHKLSSYNNIKLIRSYYSHFLVGCIDVLARHERWNNINLLTTAYLLSMYLVSWLLLYRYSVGVCVCVCVRVNCKRLLRLQHNMNRQRHSTPYRLVLRHQHTQQSIQQSRAYSYLKSKRYFS